MGGGELWVNEHLQLWLLLCIGQQHQTQCSQTTVSLLYEDGLYEETSRTPMKFLGEIEIVVFGITYFLNKATVSGKQQIHTVGLELPYK